MPPVIAAAAPALASFSLSNFLIGTALSLALNAVTGALFGKSKPKSSATETPRKDLIRSSAEPRKIIYGQSLVGGTLVFAASRGNKNQYLDLVIAIAGHKCQGLNKIYFNDEEVPFINFTGGGVYSGKYGFKAYATFYDGDKNQLASSPLQTAYPGLWTANHRLRGVAYVWIMLVYDQNAFPSGIPTPTFLVRGKNDIYDPRDGLYKYTDNAALCIRDYIRSSSGLNCLPEEVNEDLFISGANVCDEIVTLGGGETQTRYTINGMISLDEKPIDVLEDLLTACAGSVVYTAGQYAFYAGAYRTPTLSIGVDDIITAPEVTPRMPREELFNRVRGTYINPDDYWQETDFPAIENATYEAQDNEQITRDIILRFTNETVRAQRLARIHLEKSRQAMTVKVTLGFRGLQVAVMEPLYLTVPELGWTNKVFLPIKWDLDIEEGITVILQEESPVCYEWNSGDAIFYDPAPNTQLPDSTNVSAPLSLTVSTESVLTTGTSSVQKLVASWAPITDSFVLYGGRINAQIKKSSDLSWLPSFQSLGDQNHVDFLQVEPGVQYDIQVQAVNVRGIPSAWSTISGVTVGGSTGGVTSTSDWGLIADAVATSNDWGAITAGVTTTSGWGGIA